MHRCIDTIDTWLIIEVRGMAMYFVSTRRKQFGPVVLQRGMLIA